MEQAAARVGSHRVDQDERGAHDGGGGRRRSAPARFGRRLAVVALALSLLGFLPTPRPAEAAGLSLPVNMGQRFIGSQSPPKPMILPLATKIGPIRPLAVAGIQGTTFAAIKDPIFGATILSGNDVKQIVLKTINGIPDDTTLGFKVNALAHPNPTEFQIGGNCVGADGANTPFCVAEVTFKPASAGLKSSPVKADITITQGMPQVEESLRLALSEQGLVGSLINVVYPLVRPMVQGIITDGIEGAMLDPVMILSGTGVAGPFTDPAAFVRRQFADFAHGTPSSTQINDWVKLFENNTPPAHLIDALRRGQKWDGTVGPVTRLYQAYFLRSPDTSGLKFWIDRSRRGTRLYAISSNFAASSEFTRRYGSLSDLDFVKLIYQNVLMRQPDPSGLEYWTRQLRNGQTRGRLMVGFSESSEYIRKTAPKITVVELWYGMLKRAPTPQELHTNFIRLEDALVTVPNLINEVMASPEYRKLVTGA